MQVDDSRGRDDGAQAEGASLSGEQGKVSARGVAEGCEAIEVERIAPSELADERERGCDVVDRAGIATARVADPPILDVPGRDPVTGEVDAEMTSVGEVVDRLPVAPMHDDDERVRAHACS